MDFSEISKLGSLIEKFDMCSTIVQSSSSILSETSSESVCVSTNSKKSSESVCDQTSRFEEQISGMEFLGDVGSESESVQATYKDLPPEFYSPGGRQIIWIPDNPDCIKLKLKSKFPSIQDAIDAYKEYASKAGFDVRKGTTKYRKKDHLLSHRYMLCNREGAPQTVDVDTTDLKKNRLYRNSNIKRRECQAYAKFRRVGDSEVFELYKFEERHNHALVCEELRHFLRMNRQLDFSAQKFIEKMARLKVGPSRAYSYMQELRGAFNIDGGTVVDYKNQSRKVNCFIGDNDTQMIVDKYIKKKEEDPSITFEVLGKKGSLVSIFWADEAAKANYKEFGDIVSFDSTFRTNKYRMVFVPFTGIDNHRKNVTFAIGLMSSETIAAYIWLLETFLKTFGRQPTVVLTDEDAAMKVAIETVFPQSRHRLCMWHISQKMPSKLCPDVSNDVEFKKLFNKLIWSSRIDEKQFDISWRNLINQYNLQENTWLNKVFDIRRRCIPAFFRDIPLYGLMRTTSRSESANSAFNKTAHWGNSFVKFFGAFETTMDKQRHMQCFLDHISSVSKVKTRISLKIMDHAAEVYTNELFKRVKIEIEDSVFCCCQQSINSEELFDTMMIMEFKNGSERTSRDVISDDSENDSEYYVPQNASYFKVVHDKKESSFDCSCSKFIKHGYLCKHIFCVFRTFDINKIPSKYILRRWCKGVIPIEVLLKRCSDDTSEKFSLTGTSNDIVSFVKESLYSMKNDEEKINQFFDLIKEARLKVEGGSSSSSNQSIADLVHSTYGVTKPITIDIGNPLENISNKGCGKGKRLKGAKEKGIAISSKTKRYCSNCKLYVSGHNSRSCERVQKLAKEKEDASKRK